MLAGGIVCQSSSALRRARALRTTASIVLLLWHPADVPMTPNVASFGYRFGLFNVPMGCGSAFGHPGSDPRFLADAWSSNNGSRQAVLLVNIGEHSRLATASAAIRHALETAYCANNSR
jgi:hypothetical protein